MVLHLEMAVRDIRRMALVVQLQTEMVRVRMEMLTLSVTRMVLLKTVQAMVAPTGIATATPMVTDIVHQETVPRAEEMVALTDTLTAMVTVTG